MRQHVESHERSKIKQNESQTEKKESQPAEETSTTPADTPTQSQANDSANNASVEQAKCQIINTTPELPIDLTSETPDQNKSTLPQNEEDKNSPEANLNEIDRTESEDEVHIVIDLSLDDKIEVLNTKDLAVSKVEAENVAKSSESNTQIILEAERIEANLVESSSPKQTEKLEPETKTEDTPDIIEIKPESIIDLSRATVVFEVKNGDGGVSNVIFPQLNLLQAASPNQASQQLLNSIRKPVLTKKQLQVEQDAKISDSIDKAIAELKKKSAEKEQDDLKRQTAKVNEVQFKAGYRKRLIQSVENSFVNMGETKKSKTEEKAEESAVHKCTICPAKVFDTESKF
jgi:hypothetical protein